jgi:hypothetical protein
VYVSTAYSQCPQDEIKEEVYSMDKLLPEENVDGENGTKYR